MCCAKKKASTPKPVSILTVHGASTMTQRQRCDISNWLRKLASDLETHGELYAKRFIARKFKRS